MELRGVKVSLWEGKEASGIKGEVRVRKRRVGERERGRKGKGNKRVEKGR